MGLFDYVDAPDITCRCGAVVTGWQSKDGPCELGVISTANVDNYYAPCDACHAWHEFRRVRPPDIPFEHYVRDGW